MGFIMGLSGLGEAGDAETSAFFSPIPEQKMAAEQELRFRMSPTASAPA
jgi:hypothetical protein